MSGANRVNSMHTNRNNLGKFKSILQPSTNTGRPPKNTINIANTDCRKCIILTWYQQKPRWLIPCQTKNKWCVKYFIDKSNFETIIMFYIMILSNSTIYYIIILYYDFINFILYMQCLFISQNPKYVHRIIRHERQALTVVLNKACRHKFLKS